MGSVRQVLLNVSAVLLISIGAPAFGQGGGWPGPGGPVRVDGFDVEEVPGLAPGTELVFSLFGTPNALATLQIDGARRDLQLHEVEPGVYEGSYILDEHDRVDPSARVVASLRRGNDEARAHSRFAAAKHRGVL